MVCDDKGKTRGCNINELKDLKKLKGKLLIEDLRRGRVKMIHAKKAEHDREDNASEEKGLLEALEPPHGIESLEIWNYKGDRCAWYLDSNYGELRTLRLNCCPSLGALASMPLLKSLEIFQCDGLNTIGDLPALESLEIEKSDALNRIGDMPALELLKVKGCGRLKTVANMPALKSLRVEGCERLKTLANMPVLELLVVSRCKRLEQVADDHMPALKWLRLSYLNILKQLPTRLPSLKVLYVEDLPNWESTFTSMPCLRGAEFWSCPKMKMEGLSDELAGLHKLRVKNCPSARMGWKLLKQLPNLIELKLDPESTVLVRQHEC